MKTPLEADLRSRDDITFDSMATRYRGSISYDKGRTAMRSTHLGLTGFSAKFNATPSVLRSSLRS